jgi:hypothetical protein
MNSLVGDFEQVSKSSFVSRNEAWQKMTSGQLVLITPKQE